MKKTFRAFFQFLLLSLFICPSLYAETGFQDKLWLALNGSTKYAHTAFNIESYDGSYDDYYPASLVLNGGIRHDFNEDLFLDIYLHTSLKQDFASEEWNNVSWRNNWSWAPTARLGYRLIDDYDNNAYRKIWMEELSFNFFAAYTNTEDSFDSGKNEIAPDTYSENLRIGVDSYMSISSKRYGDTLFWLEFWNELAFQQEYNDISEYPNQELYSFQSQPVLGMSWFIGRLAIQPYIQCYLAYDFGSEDYNKVSWANRVQYGPGLRLSLGDFIPIEDASFYLFGELAWIEYFGRVDPEEYVGTADNDFILGLKFRLPFGAIKNYVSIH